MKKKIANSNLVLMVKLEIPLDTLGEINFPSIMEYFREFGAAEIEEIFLEECLT